MSESAERKDEAEIPPWPSPRCGDKNRVLSPQVRGERFEMRCYQIARGRRGTVSGDFTRLNPSHSRYVTHHYLCTREGAKNSRSREGRSREGGYKVGDKSAAARFSPSHSLIEKLKTIYSEFKMTNLKSVSVSRNIEWNSQGKLHATPAHFRCKDSVG